MSVWTPRRAARSVAAPVAPRCHDHKFDPISIKDYYGLAGVFASTQSTIRPLNTLDPETEKRFISARQRYIDLAGAITNLSENKDIDQKTATEKFACAVKSRPNSSPRLEALRDKYPELAPLITHVITPRIPAAPAQVGEGISLRKERMRHS